MINRSDVYQPSIDLPYCSNSGKSAHLRPESIGRETLAPVKQQGLVDCGGHVDPLSRAKSQ